MTNNHVPKCVKNNFMDDDDEPDDDFLSTQARQFLMAPDADPLPD